MTNLIDSKGAPYSIIVAHRRKADEAAVLFDDERGAFVFLRRMAQDDVNRTAIRRFALDAGFVGEVHPRSDYRLLKYLAAKIITGQLLIVRPGEREEDVTSDEPKHDQPAKADPPPAKEEPPPAKNEKTWIKFEIVDEDTGKPVCGVTLKVKLPDGQSRNATSNAAGLIEITNIPPGTCDIERMVDSDTLEVVSIQ